MQLPTTVVSGWWNRGMVEAGNVLQTIKQEPSLVLSVRDYSSNQKQPCFWWKDLLVHHQADLACGLPLTKGWWEVRASFHYPTNFLAVGQHARDSRGTGMMDLQEAQYFWNIPAYWPIVHFREGCHVRGYMENGLPYWQLRLKVYQWVGDRGFGCPAQFNGFRPWLITVLYQEKYKHWKRSRLLTGKAVYEHKAKPVQVYSPATATITQGLMRGVLNSGATNDL